MKGALVADEDTTLETEDSVQDTQEQANDVDWQKRFTDTQAEYTRQQQILKDRDAWLAHGQENFPDAFEEAPEPPETVDDDDSSEYDDEPEVLTKAEFKAYQEQERQRIQDEKNTAEYEANFKKFVGDRELDKYGDAALRSQVYANAQEHEAAVNAYFEYLDSLGAKPRKKRPTSPLPGGKTATGVPDYSDMTREQIDQLMAERVRALEAQT